LYLLWFILINYISCGVSQSTNVLMVFFFFAMGHLVGLSPKNYEIPPFPTFFTLFYTYTILHSCKKKLYVRFTFTWLCKTMQMYLFLYLHIVIFKPFTCTTLVHTQKKTSKLLKIKFRLGLKFTGMLHANWKQYYRSPSQKRMFPRGTFNVQNFHYLCEVIRYCAGDIIWRNLFLFPPYYYIILLFIYI
jgi:hypothetical protein